MEFYNPRNIRNVMRGRFETGGLLDTRINKESSIDEVYEAAGPKYAGDTVYKPVENSYAAENKDLYSSQGTATPVSRDDTPAETTSAYVQMADYSTLRDTPRVEQLAAREITDAIAEVTRDRDTEALTISDTVQDSQDTLQDKYSEVTQETGAYDWLNDYQDLLSNEVETEKALDDAIAPDTDSYLEILMENIEADMHGTDMLDDTPESADAKSQDTEPEEVDVEYVFQY